MERFGLQSEINNTHKETMTMKKLTKFLFVAVFFSLFTMGASAQNKNGKADDIGRIILSPYVVSNANIPSYAVPIVENKLTQIVTKQGVSGLSLNNRFVITANLVEMSKEVTATTPAMIAVTLTPTIYIGDVVTGDLYSSCELPLLRGVGETETKAYINAVKALNVNHQSVVLCINSGKKRIIEYYNSQIDFIIADAMALVDSQQFDEAMLVLASVPDVCKDAYVKAHEKIGEIYKKKVDLEGEKLYNEAYATWNTAKTKESATRVVELLAEINPVSSAAEKSRVLVKEVEGYYAELEERRREIEERNWAFMVMQYEDEQEYRKQTAKYDYEIQMEYAKSSAAAYECALHEVKEIVSAMGTRNVIYDAVKTWY